MAIVNNSSFFRDVNQYAANLLKKTSKGVEMAASYEKVWDDGFGARGWKLNATLGDPEIIASTRQTGQRLNTSVFVHDILDHFLSGFGVSGHRSEAMALVQLSRRTSSDPRPDFMQIINEDIMNGRVNGETLRDFLPGELLSLLPSDEELTEKEIISQLKEAMGKEALVKVLVDHFFKLGEEGKKHAAESWKKLGLDHDNTASIGMAIQQLLEQVDSEAEASGINKFDASIVLNNKECTFIIKTDDPHFSESVIRASIAK